MPATISPNDHPGPEELYDLIEKRLSRAKLRDVEGHLDRCEDCLESLAMMLRAERPASPKEQEILAGIPEKSPEERVEALRRHIVASSPARRRAGPEWKPILLAAVGVAIFASVAIFVYQGYWLPAESRRIASETLSSLVELRQATGRIPLRYFEEFERASVTRSGFDRADPAEEVLLENLRSAVARAPDPEAVRVLGLLLLDEGELDEAERLLQQVLDENPSSVDALNGLAVVYYERSRRRPAEAYQLLQRGLALLRRAQAAAPEDLRVLYNFGMFYEALEMPSAAAQAWARYLEIDGVSQWAEEAAYHLAQLQPR